MYINSLNSDFLSKTGGSLLSGLGNSSKKKWELTEDLTKNILELAKEDAAKGVYMGNEYHALQKNEVSKVSPDREAIKAKVTSEIKSQNARLQNNDDLYSRWVILVFGTPYGVKGNSMEFGNSIRIYDENGDEILCYTGGVGWQYTSSRAEINVDYTLTHLYHEAYCNERSLLKQNINLENEFQYSETESSFEIIA